MASAPDHELRWVQRFESLQASIANLNRFCAKPNLSELEQVGVVKAFEIALELAWKTLQDLLKHRGYTDAVGPRPVIQQAIEDGLVHHGDTWLMMLKTRNITAHTYHKATLEQILKALETSYLPAFNELVSALLKIKSAGQ